jgi:hypothetical protein
MARTRVVDPPPRCPDCGSGLSAYGDYQKCNSCGLEKFRGIIRRPTKLIAACAEQMTTADAGAVALPTIETEQTALISTADDVSGMAPPLSEAPQEPQRKDRKHKSKIPPRNYKSGPKKQVSWALRRELRLTDMELCRFLDSQGEIPDRKMMTRERSFEAAYRDPKIKPNLQSLFSKVRRDLRAEGLL